MNRATKIIVILMITTIVIYVVVGVYNVRINEINQNNISGDQINSGEDTSNLDEDRMIYEITSGDNEVILKGISEGVIITTTYNFNDNKLISIVMNEEITSGDEIAVEKIYNHMKTDENMSMVYSNIQKDGMSITANLKDEYVASYGEATKDEIYNEIVKSLELSE